MNDYLDISIELGSGLVLLFLITKLLGKTQISQITPFEFISALVLGELVGNAIFDDEVGLVKLIFALGIWVVLLYIIEKVEMKFIKSRGLIEGDPSIVVRNGWIDRRELKKNKLSINQLQNLLRQRDVFSIREIAFAIIESNGMISVMRKPEFEPAVRSEQQITSSSPTLPVTFISDGTVITDSLNSNGYNKQWLQKQIEAQGYARFDEIFYAEWDENEGLFLVPQQLSS